MVHWDSSTRPLFVRTVWKNGQHHVILQKSEEDAVKPPLNTRRSVCSASSGKSTSRSPKIITTATSNIKVSSVKILIGGLKNLKTEKTREKLKSAIQQPSRNNYTIEIIPSNPVYYQDVNRKVSFIGGSFNNRQRHKSCRPIKSNSFDVNDKETHESTDYYLNNYGIGVTPCFTYDNQYNNNLSERVLIWLDLATQNGNYRNGCEEVQMTALPRPPIPKRQPPVKNTKHLYHFEQEINQNNLHVSGTQQGNINNTNVSEEEAAPVEVIRINKMEHRVTSRPEEHYLIEDVSDIQTNRVCTAKRQLHIFMPNLPNKFSDSESLLSSKCSSIYTHKSIISNSNEVY